MTLQDGRTSSHFLDTTKHMNWLLLNLPRRWKSHERKSVMFNIAANCWVGIVLVADEWNIKMEPSWNDNARRIPKYREKCPCHWHFVHHKWHALARNRTQSSVLGGLQLTARAMSWARSTWIRVQILKAGCWNFGSNMWCSWRCV